MDLVQLLDAATPSTGSKVMDLVVAMQGEIDSGRESAVEMPTQHYFLPGVYLREIFMPAGTVVVGKVHKTRHFNIVQKGKLAYSDGKTLKFLEAPCTFVSDAGVQKALYIIEDCTWTCVHLTDNREMEVLESELIEPSEHYPLIGRDEERKAIALAAETEKQPAFLLEHK